MFFALRNAAIVLFYLTLAGAGVFAYQKRDVLEPVWDHYELWRNQADKPLTPVGEVRGQVVTVYAADRFALRDERRRTHQFQIFGVTPPVAAEATHPATRKRIDTGRAELAGLILSNNVAVRVIAPGWQQTGTGIVLLEGTNVSRLLLERGSVRLRRDLIRGLPLGEQKALVSAERKARQRRVGVWSNLP